MEKESLIDWIKGNRNKSTLKNYELIVKEYLQYTVDKNLNPKTDVGLASFMRYVVQDRKRKLGRQTACGMVPAAIADYYQYDREVNVTESPLIRQTRKILMKITPTPSKGRLPLTFDILQKIVVSLGRNIEDIRNMFMIVLMTKGMLRESEAVNLKREHVYEVLSKDNEPCLNIYVAKSKTDQAGDGSNVILATSEDCVCPVGWFREYCLLRSSDSEYLFYQLSKRLYGSQLSSTTPNFIVRNMLKRVGITDPRYGSHSCRRGGATAAVEAGTDLRLVSEHGRWKSDAVLKYVIDSDTTKQSVTKNMFKVKK